MSLKKHNQVTGICYRFTSLLVKFRSVKLTTAPTLRERVQALKQTKKHDEQTDLKVGRQEA